MMVFYSMGFCAFIFILVFIFMAQVSGSRFGLALRTLREDERAAAAFGRGIYRLKLRPMSSGPHPAAYSLRT